MIPCTNIFNSCQVLINQDNHVANENTHSESLRQAVLQCHHNLERLDCSSEQKQAIQYAYAAYVDEQVMCSQLALKADWMRESLQQQIFGDHQAGVRFFQHLQQQLYAETPNASVLWIYFLCLRLGFRGEYRQNDNKILQQLQHQLFKKLQALVPTHNTPMLDEVPMLLIRDAGWQHSWYPLSLWLWAVIAIQSFCCIAINVYDYYLIASQASFLQ